MKSNVSQIIHIVLVIKFVCVVIVGSCHLILRRLVLKTFYTQDISALVILVRNKTLKKTFKKNQKTIIIVLETIY